MPRPMKLRRGLSAAVLLAVAIGYGPAVAGDVAEVEILGFSADGRHFAFEEFGLQDGSGFPYSSIYVIDVARDAWVPGSPLRRRDEIDDAPPYDPDAALARTREANRAAAVPVLRGAGIAGFGTLVGHNPPTEMSADPHHLMVVPRRVLPPIDDPLEFALTEFPLPAGHCADYGAETRGFRLTLVRSARTTVLAEDRTLPASRNCPLGYSIERILTHYPADGDPVFAVLLLMETVGFEGPDGRYLAVTGRF
ncbi:DUF2259 domain-containing protein [Polymorphum gilvum]|uniref:Secreted protein n=1 Tax=Polymorphum gilvum (strain LMG 25793 / CGMCC 1.9160 / SL003B-26A1) TaxID=991905 RepID=F2J4X6_POLGS|nr:DUF2259 domain-containing protein [Polymorphum gilvum]ADZ70018.1 hypothetical protein SL003B_1590 [Polymorphum gilvum SL003B-26A1]